MNTTSQERDSVKSLFSFIEEVAGIRQAVTKNLSKCPWKFDVALLDPTLPGITVRNPAALDSDLVCKLERLNVPLPPALPEGLLAWVEGDWQRADAALRWKAEIFRPIEQPAKEGEALLERTAFDDDPARGILRGQWLEKRTAWLAERQIILDGNAVFDRFLAMRDLLNESNLRYECVLGNYIFTSDPRLTINQADARYPLVVQAVKIELKSSPRNLPMIEVRRSGDEPVRFLTEVLQAFADEKLDFTAVRDIEALIEEGQPSPVGTPDLSKRIQQMTVRLSPACRWHEAGTPLESLETGVKFRIEEGPVLLVQSRSSGLREAVKRISEEIDETGDIPHHLLEIVCPDVAPVIAPEPETRPAFEEALAATAGEDEDILLTKPANAEQLAIAREIMRNNVVLVQGPPGTGKTHTIANLLGHFLAQGKRVLVTSHTAKALSVLKEKLPPEIQPLCVSMLGDRRDLEKTAVALKNRIGTMSLADLREKIDVLTEERRHLLWTLRETRQKIFALRLKETKGPVYNGTEYSIVALAKKLKAEESLASLIPGEVAQGTLQLSPDELRELYETNGTWSAEEEAELSQLLPSLDALPDPVKMREMCAEYARLTRLLREGDEESRKAAVSSRSDARGVSFLDFSLPDGERLSVRAADAQALLADVGTSFLDRAEGSAMLEAAFEAGIEDPQFQGIFSDLAEMLRRASSARRALEKSRLTTGLTVSIPARADWTALEAAFAWFARYAPTGEVGFLNRLFNSDAKKALEALEGVTVNGRALSSQADFAAAAEEVRTMKEEDALRTRWNQLASRAGAPDFDAAGPRAAVLLADDYADALVRAAGWWHDVFLPYAEGLRAAGVQSARLDELLAGGSSKRRFAGAKDYLRTVLTPVIKKLRIEAEHASILRWQRDVRHTLRAGGADSAILSGLAAACLTDAAAWERGYARLEACWAEKPRFERRLQLLNRLGRSAPEWMRAVREGRPGFNDTVLPLRIFDAWDWKQLEILYRGWTADSLEDLQQKAVSRSAQLRHKTAELAAVKAWYEVKKRLDGSEALAHLSTLTTYMQRASGKGKKVAVYRQEANRILPLCQNAVPVWVMMIQDALLNFNRAAKFDIIIVDEASQADLTSIPILYMGKKVIVVGDDKQVTPLAIGMSDVSVDSLAAQYLDGKVKEAKLYDAKLSLYSVVQNTAFPAHMLVEHFRCVPEVIGFCNRLSYHGAILPLRDKTSSKLKPAIVPLRVNGLALENGLNETEAQAVVNLLRAMMADPAYEGKTFGVIAMRSGKPAQIMRLKQLVMTSFDPREIEARRLICGSSAEFQGDERDVILLSLVDSAEAGTLLRKDGDGVDGSTKKRYNVAVSRAKDQLWIVHSFDPKTQLKSDDIRSGLFAWAASCDDAAPDQDAACRSADSEFVAEVARALRKRGYRTEEQHRVGSFTLDIVVSSKGSAVVIECDGEKFHAGDKAIREDMARQTVLERNGWRFIRLRGSEYFRSPEAAVERICGELGGLGIVPEAADEPESTSVLDRVLAAYARFEKEGVPAGMPEGRSAASAPDDAADAVEAEAVEEIEPDEAGETDAETAEQGSAAQPLPERSDDALPSEPTPAEKAVIAPIEGPNGNENDSIHAACEAFAGTLAVRLREAGFEPALLREGEALVLRVKDHRVAILACRGGALEVRVPSVLGVRARGVSNYRTSEGGEWKIWSLADWEIADEEFAGNLAGFVVRSTSMLI